MDFAPYQSASPETTRALSPPPQRVLSPPPRITSPRNIGTGATSPRTSSFVRPYTDSPSAAEHSAQTPWSDVEASAGQTQALNGSGGGGGWPTSRREEVDLFETRLGLRLDYEACLAYLALPPAGAVALLVLEHKSDYVRYGRNLHPAILESIPESILDRAPMRVRNRFRNEQKG